MISVIHDFAHREGHTIDHWSCIALDDVEIYIVCMVEEKSEWVFAHYSSRACEEVYLTISDQYHPFYAYWCYGACSLATWIRLGEQQHQDYRLRSGVFVADA